MEFIDRLTTPIVNLFGAHPLVTLAIATIFPLASLIVNGLRVAYPDRTSRPRSVAFWLGILDPLALNFWSIAHRFGIRGPTDEAEK